MVLKQSKVRMVWGVSTISLLLTEKVDTNLSISGFLGYTPEDQNPL